MFHLQNIGTLFREFHLPRNSAIDLYANMVTLTLDFALINQAIA